METLLEQILGEKIRRGNWNEWYVASSFPTDVFSLDQSA